MCKQKKKTTITREEKKKERNKEKKKRKSLKYKKQFQESNPAHSIFFTILREDVRPVCQ